MKTYGIFVAYSPTARLRAEGLGRYLAAFVNAATHRDDVKIVVAAPSWSRRVLKELFEEQGISTARIDFVGPRTQPLLLRFYHLMDRFRRRRPRKATRWFPKLAAMLKAGMEALVLGLVGTRNPLVFLLYALCLVVVSPVLAIGILLLLVRRAFRLSRLYRRPYRWLIGLSQKLLSWRTDINRGIYDGMLARELELLTKIANRLPNVVAWYAPASTWPTFNQIKAPTLTAFPDLVFLEFPVAFSAHKYGATRVGRNIRKTVAGGHYFVTYSERIKRSVLVHQLGVPPERVKVVPHAPSSLAACVEVQGFADNISASRSFCLALATEALGKLVGPAQGQRFEGAGFKFLFYASQFRPSKNVLTLLRAYNDLLRRRYIGHKLVLTGNGHYEPVSEFIREHRLERDVLCLHDLSEPQLAALYKLADLAVNPSLSEGGMPFTFTEALSVGTPVVMGDIEVTREILTEQPVRDATLFDPYDWRALADKVEWALGNREELYSVQREFYDRVLAKRSWEDVVAEHIAILDEISGQQHPARLWHDRR